MLAESSVFDKHDDDHSDAEQGEYDDDDNTDQDVGDARVLQDSIIVVTKVQSLSNSLTV